MRVSSFAQNSHLSQGELGAFFNFEYRFFEFLAQIYSKMLDFAYFKPFFAHFRVRQTTLSTWVKTPKGLKIGQKWGL